MRYVLLCGLLAGCGGVGHILQEYMGVPAVSYDLVGAQWRIFDKADDGKLMITPSNARAQAAGRSQAGIALYQTEGAFRPAADAYVAGKGCAVTGGHLVVPFQYEFTYSC